MAETTKYVGAYTHKEPMNKFLLKYRVPLAMIALVHERGARKYSYGSWCNTPEP